ncbi:MAG TPA: hypothetical protein VEZ20_03245 [Allosphingosinicella sp.]|jgi:hypothetical protein|nr:hypothetical protein [Allosphingosinicella sp.]
MIERNKHWEIIANYESAELVRRQFTARHGRSLNAAKAQEICAAFTQARGYMQSASEAERVVRPLLTYYGVLSLSRGLALFLSTQLREAGLAQAHGLGAEAWGDELSRNGGSVAALKIKINPRGTFRQLLEATEHLSYLRSNSSAPNHIQRCDMPPASAELTFLDALSRLPEIRATFRRWRDERHAVAFWPQGVRPDGRHEFRVDSPYTLDDVRAVLGDIPEVTDDSGRSLTLLVPSDMDLPPLSDSTGSFGIGEIVALARWPTGLELSKIALAFVASYGLGMLVRYFPAHWISMLQNRAHDAAVPTLLAALDHVETEFPRFVVEFLEPPDSLPAA